MDFSSFEAFVDSALVVLDNYGFLLIILFGIAHPLLEGPFHLFNLSLAILLLGIPLGYITVFLSNVIGVIVLYLIITRIDKASNYYLHKKNVSSNVLEWIKNTKRWKHIVVIGVPLIPTYPIKLGVPLSRMSFKDTMITLVGSYLFLFLGNTLIYYGLLNIFESGISRIISIIVLLILVILIYFGKDIVNKLKEVQPND